MSDAVPERPAAMRLPIRAWLLTLCVLAANVALIATLSNRCAAAGTDYRCAPPFDGLENVLLWSLLVTGLAFVITLALAIIKMADWVRVSRSNQ